MGSRWQDTPAAVFLRLLADLMVTNVLAILCSVPLVTVGASFSAMYAVFFRREQDEGNVEVIRTFFRAFKGNFWKATALGFLQLLIFVVAAGDFWFAFHSEPPLRAIYQVVGTVIAFVGLIFFVMALPQQAVYQNTIAGYLKNSVMLAMCAPAQMLLALLCWVLPWCLAFAIPEDLLQFGVVYLVCGLSLPAWATTKVLTKVFAKTKQADA